jgi:hypothetical protein
MRCEKIIEVLWQNGKPARNRGFGRGLVTGSQGELTVNHRAMTRA